MSSEYERQLEQRNEELQQKLAIAQFEAEEYKKIVKERVGQLVVVQDTAGAASKLAFVADKVFKACRDSSYQWVYELVKDRTGKTGKIYTLEEMREKARNFWK
jgi:hypothetical protein